MVYKIIAFVKSEEEFDIALKSKVEIIFYSEPNIITLHDNVKRVHEAGKKIFIHFDFAQGIGKDRYGMQYAKSMGIDGIISTRVNIIKLAKEEGIFTVQRFFLVDTRSIETTADSLKASKPDMIEVMPGVVPKVIGKLRKMTDVPIIAGGLIENKKEIESALSCGAAAISCGNSKLWNE